MPPKSGELAQLAARLNERERGWKRREWDRKVGHMRHAKEQGDDLIRFRAGCKNDFVKRLAAEVTEFGQAQAYRYIKFAELTPPAAEFIETVKHDPEAREAYWDLWQKTQDNKSRGGRQKDKGPPLPESGIDSSFLTLLPTRELADEIGPMLAALRKKWDTKGAAIESIRFAYKEVCGG